MATKLATMRWCWSQEPAITANAIKNVTNCGPTASPSEEGFQRPMLDHQCRGRHQQRQREGEGRIDEGNRTVELGVAIRTRRRHNITIVNFSSSSPITSATNYGTGQPASRLRTEKALVAERDA